MSVGLNPVSEQQKPFPKAGAPVSCFLLWTRPGRCRPSQSRSGQGDACSLRCFWRQCSCSTLPSPESSSNTGYFLGTDLSSSLPRSSPCSSLSCYLGYIIFDIVSHNRETWSFTLDWVAVFLLIVLKWDNRGKGLNSCGSFKIKDSSCLMEYLGWLRYLLSNVGCSLPAVPTFTVLLSKALPGILFAVLCKLPTKIFGCSGPSVGLQALRWILVYSENELTACHYLKRKVPFSL